MNIVKADASGRIVLGRQGENNVTQVLFDISGFIREFGSGVAQLAVQLPKYSKTYAAPVEQDEYTATWTVGAEWLTTEGAGQCQLSWYVNDKVAKTKNFQTYVFSSIGTGTEAPEPYEGYLEQVQQAGAQAMAAAERAEEAAKRAEGSVGNGGTGFAYEIGHGLKVVDGTTLEVDAVSNFDGDNTLPITAAAVQTTVGNIELILQTI